jgi:hypothetical protein
MERLRRVVALAVVFAMNSLSASAQQATGVE